MFSFSRSSITFFFFIYLNGRILCCASIIFFFRCLRNDNEVERNLQDFSIYSTMDERNLAAYGLMTVEELSFVWRESCHCFSSVFFFFER